MIRGFFTVLGLAAGAAIGRFAWDATAAVLEANAKRRMIELQIAPTGAAMRALIRENDS